jgi:hypothetical protein
MVAPVPAQISKLPRRKLSCPTRRSTPNSRPVNLLQPLVSFSNPCPLFSTACSLFSQNTGGGVSRMQLRDTRVGGDHSVASVLRPQRSLCCAFSCLPARNPFAPYHIPATPAFSCNYALFSATARRYPSCNQEVPHSFYRHGGVPPSEQSRSFVPCKEWQRHRNNNSNYL